MKISRFTIHFLIFCITVLLTSPTVSSFIPTLGSFLNYFDKIFIIVIFIIFLLLFFRRKTIKMYFPTYLLLIAILFALISNFIESKANGAMIVQLLLTFQGLITLYLLSQFDYDERDIELLIKFLLVFGFISTLVGFFELILPNVVRTIFHGGKIQEEAVLRGSFVSIQSIFSHPGQFSWFISLCLCISYVKYTFSERRIYIFISVLFMIMLILTLRRKSIIAMFIVIIAITMLNSSGVKSKIRNLFLASSIIVSTFFLFYEQIQYVFIDAIERYSVSENTTTQNIQPRIVLANASVEIASDKFPFGSGLGTFGSWMSKVNYSDIYHEYGVSDYWGLSPQNDQYLNDTYWPMIIGEFGFLGAFFLLSFYLMIFKFFMNNIKYASNLKLKCYLMLGFSVYLELFIESFSSPSLSRSPQVFIVMAILGMVVAYCFNYSKSLRFK